MNKQVLTKKDEGGFLSCPYVLSTQPSTLKHETLFTEPTLPPMPPFSSCSPSPLSAALSYIQSLYFPGIVTPEKVYAIMDRINFHVVFPSGVQ